MRESVVVRVLVLVWAVFSAAMTFIAIPTVRHDVAAWAPWLDWVQTTAASWAIPAIGVIFLLAILLLLVSPHIGPRRAKAEKSERPRERRVAAVSFEDDSSENVVGELYTDSPTAVRASERATRNVVGKVRPVPEQPGEDDPPAESRSRVVVMRDRVELSVYVGMPFLPLNDAICEVTHPSGVTYRVRVRPSAPRRRGSLQALGPFAPHRATVIYPMEFDHAPQRLDPGAYRVVWNVLDPLGLIETSVHDAFRVPGDVGNAGASA